MAQTDPVGMKVPSWTGWLSRGMKSSLGASGWRLGPTSYCRARWEAWGHFHTNAFMVTAGKQSVPHAKDGSIRDILDDLGLKQILTFTLLWRKCGFLHFKFISTANLFKNCRPVWHLSLFLLMHLHPFLPVLHPYFGFESRAAQQAQLCPL